METPSYLFRRAQVLELLLLTPGGEEAIELLESVASAETRAFGSADWATIPALYWAAADSYNGQGDPLYALVCILEKFYRPGALESGVQEGPEQELYDSLVGIFSRA